MKLLLIIDSLSAQRQRVEETINYCLQHHHDLFVVELGAPVLVADTPDVPGRIAQLTLPQASSSDVRTVADDLRKIKSALAARHFTPDAVEFFDAPAMAHLFLEYDLACEATNDHEVIYHYNITSQQVPDFIRDVDQYSLPAFHTRSRMEWLMSAVTTTCCHQPEVYAALSAYVAKRNGLQQILDLTDADKLGIKYQAHQPRPRNRYPFLTEDAVLLPVKETAPLLSVVIPYHNMGAYIAETLASVLGSTYAPLEVIVVDDGSTHPASVEALEKLEGLHPNVRILRQENAGVAAARNNGIRSAKGSIVALLDADDLVEKYYYEKAVHMLTRYDNVSFVGCWTEFADERGLTDSWITALPELPLFFLMNTINTQSIVVKREALLRAGLHDSTLNMMLDDWEAAINLVAHGYRGVVIPAFLFRYRIRMNSIYRSRADEWSRSYQKIIAKHKDTVGRHAEELMMLLTANGPNIFYKDVRQMTDYDRIMNTLPNYRIRDSFLTRMINRYYNFVELNPLGTRIRRALDRSKKLNVPQKTTE